MGPHDYSPIASTGLCEHCLLGNGDCVSSPAWDSAKPDGGRYLHSTKPVLQIAAGKAKVLVPAEDYMAVQAERDEMRRQLGFLNMAARTGSAAGRLGRVLGMLDQAGLDKADADAMAGIMAFARRHASSGA